MLLTKRLDYVFPVFLVSCASLVSRLAGDLRGVLRFPSCGSSNITCMTSGVTFGVQPPGRLDQKVAIHELRQLLRRRIGKKRELFIGLVSTGSRYELLCWV